ncbi:hypothetical protein V1525DRAFT_392615, partial [Lipomyces kononenkoae]
MTVCAPRIGRHIVSRMRSTKFISWPGQLLPVTTIWRGSWVYSVHQSARHSSCKSPAAVLELTPLPPTLKQKEAEVVQFDVPSGTAVTVNGWIRTIRKHKKFAFVNITDGSYDKVLQLVFSDPEQMNDLGVGVSLEVNGTIQRRDSVTDPYEILVEKYHILGGVPEEEPYPLQNKYLSQDYLRRELPTIRFRSMSNGVTMRFRSRAVYEISRYFEENEFVQTHPPLITSSDCEGAGEVFTVVSETSASPFFGKNAYLTVSTQLHLEALMMGLSRVWTLSPAFRAEKSITSRHLSEFWMLEAEVAFAHRLEHVMSLVERLLRTTLTRLKESGELQSILSVKNFLEKQKDQVGEGDDKDREITHELVLQRWDGMLQDAPWKRITYKQAIEVLQQAEAEGKVKFETSAEYGDNLKSEHEKWLAAHYASGPIFVTHYPSHLKPFYMLPTPGSDGQTVECFDLLVPGLGELVGGSLREYDYKRLQATIERVGMDLSELEWYVELRKWGSVPHGGFGLGLERLMSYLVGIYNVRDVIAFPRWVDHCVC